MTISLSRVEANLTRMGLSPLLKELLAGPLHETVEMNFGSLKIAKTVMRLLYQFMTFHPEVKSYTGMRLREEIATLEIIPKAGPERRGRKHIY